MKRYMLHLVKTAKEKLTHFSDQLPLAQASEQLTYHSMMYYCDILFCWGLHPRMVDQRFLRRWSRPSALLMQILASGFEQTSLNGYMHVQKKTLFAPIWCVGICFIMQAYQKGKWSSVKDWIFPIYKNQDGSKLILLDPHHQQASQPTCACSYESDDYLYVQPFSLCSPHSLSWLTVMLANSSLRGCMYYESLSK